MGKQRLTWRRILPGLIISGTLLVLAMVVLFRARVGVLRGDAYRVYALANEARGVIKGTEVWLDGQKVGIVDDIRFRPPSADTAERILLALSVLEDRKPLIRKDSRVNIRSGGRLISSPVIQITAGTMDAPVLAERDTLHPARQSDMETLASELALAARQAAPLFQNLRHLGTLLGRSREQLRSARTDRGEAAIHSVRRDARRLSSSTASGGGTLGALMRDDSLLVERARRSLSLADSVLAFAQRPDGLMSRLQRDSVVGRNLASMRNELSIVRARLESAEGTMGRLARDSALTWQLRRREQALGELIADIKRDPGRYIVF